MNVQSRRPPYEWFLPFLLLFSFLTKVRIPAMGDVVWYQKFYETLLHSGTFWRPDLPVAIYTLYFTARAIGFYNAYKFLICLFYTLLAVPVFFLAKSVYGSGFSGLLAATAVTFNDYVARLVLYGGLKAGLGYLFSLSAILSLLWLGRKDEKRYAFMFLALSSLTLLTHTMASGVLAVFVFFYLFIGIAKHTINKVERIVTALFIATFAVLVTTGLLMAYVVPSKFYFRRFGEIIHLVRTFEFVNFTLKVKIDFVAFVLMAFTILYPLILFLSQHHPKVQSNRFVATLSATGAVLFAIAFVTGGHDQEFSHRFLQASFLPFSMLVPYCTQRNSFFLFVLVYVFFGAMRY